MSDDTRIFIADICKAFSIVSTGLGIFAGVIAFLFVQWSNAEGLAAVPWFVAKVSWIVAWTWAGSQLLNRKIGGP